MENEFEKLIKDFEEKPSFVPTPPKIDQKKLLKKEEETTQNLKELEKVLAKLEVLVDKDFSQCKIEFFNLDFLLSKIPEQAKNPGLLARIKNIEEKMLDKEKELEHAEIAQRQEKHYDELEPEIDNSDIKQIEKQELKFKKQTKKQEKQETQEIEDLEKKPPFMEENELIDKDLDDLQKSLSSLKTPSQKKIHKYLQPKNREHQFTTKKDGLESEKLSFIQKKDVVEGVSVEELYTQGIYHFSQKQYQEAINCFQEIIKKSPNNMAARIRLQQVYDEMSHKKQKT